MLMLLSRLGPGLFLLDEPESALSPHRQLTLLARMAERAGAGSPDHGQEQSPSVATIRRTRRDVDAGPD